MEGELPEDKKCTWSILDPSSWDDRVVGLFLFVFVTSGLMLLATKGAFPKFLGLLNSKDEGDAPSPEKLEATPDSVVPETVNGRKYIEEADNFKFFRHRKCDRTIFHNGKLYTHYSDDEVNTYTLLSGADFATLVDEDLLLLFMDEDPQAFRSNMTPAKLLPKLKFYRPLYVADAYDKIEQEQDYPVGKAGFIRSAMPHFKKMKVVIAEIMET